MPKHYNENRVVKGVSFNDKEKHLLEFAKTFDFSKGVKTWLESELAKRGVHKMDKPTHHQPEIDRYLLLNDGAWYQLLNGHWFAIKHLGKYEVVKL